MDNKIRQPEKGFIEPVILPEDWWLGASGTKVIREDGDWRHVEILNEHQAPNFESFGCTEFGKNNQSAIV